MTFKELLEAAEALREKGDRISIQVSVWVDDDGRTNLCWTIWSGNRGTLFTGATAESALAKYREQLPTNGLGVDPIPDPRQPELIEAPSGNTPDSKTENEEVPY